MANETFIEELTERVRKARSMFCMEYGTYPDMAVLGKETLREVDVQLIRKHVLCTDDTPSLLGQLWELNVGLAENSLPLGVILVRLRGTDLYLGLGPVPSKRLARDERAAGAEDG